MKYLSAIRAIVRQCLRDEYLPGQEYAFEDDEIDIHIALCLEEISERRPYEVKETLTTTTGSKELDISTIEDLLELDPGHEIEYPVGKDPPDYHNASRFGDTVRMEVDRVPGAGESVYLYCHKVHQLTESQSTLNLELEKVLVEGVVAKVALAWVNTIRSQIRDAITTIASVSTLVDNMTARITQAITDLTSGRAFIGNKSTQAIAAIDEITGRVTQAKTDLTSGRAIIGQKRTQALSAIDSMTTQLTQAVNDLTTGRGKIEDVRTQMDTAIDNMSARISQAMTDLTAGRELINKINIGGAPELDYARYAYAELGNALRYLDQGRGYLSEATTSDRYANYAARELQVANGFLAQARGYLATDTPVPEYASYAARELANATAYLAQARGYLAVDQPATEYGNYAARELSNAMAYLNQAGGFLREITAQLNISRAITGYQNWANNQLTLYREGLKRIAKTRVSREYPKG